MKKLTLLAGFVLALVAGVALGQVISVPLVATVGTSDIFADIVGGQPGVPSQFATAAQIAGVPGYVNLGAATTGNTYTYTNSQTYMLMQPAGTLAAVTLTAAVNPSDGQRECFLSTQTTTSLTWNANTGQTISGAPTAGVANTGACMTYVKSLAAWIRS
jgi:hypothetical protein